MVPHSARYAQVFMPYNLEAGDKMQINEVYKKKYFGEDLMRNPHPAAALPKLDQACLHMKSGGINIIHSSTMDTRAWISMPGHPLC